MLIFFRIGDLADRRKREPCSGYGPDQNAAFGPFQRHPITDVHLGAQVGRDLKAAGPIHDHKLLVDVR